MTNQKVYFDGTFLNNKSGVGRDSRNLLVATKLAFGEDVDIIYPRLRFFSRAVINSHTPSNSFFQKILKLRPIFTNKAEICHLEERSVFVQSHLHCVTPEIHLSLKYFVRLHDVFPISNPEWFRAISRRIFSIGFYSAVHSATFICDSETTQNELRNIISPLSISSTVAFCPVLIPKGKLCGLCSGCKTLSLHESHVISISTLEPRKNFSQLVTAWINSETFINRGIYLYIVGRDGWKSSKLKKEILKSESEGIRWIKDSCDESVQQLLRCSEFLVSTSFEEGFNLPVAEALIQQVPVLISNNKVHSELYFSDASFYKLGDTQDLIEQIEKMLSSERRRSSALGVVYQLRDFESDLMKLTDALRHS